LNKTGSIQINSQFDMPVIVAATTILYTWADFWTISTSFC